jgi:hypothetical protein
VTGAVSNVYFDLTRAFNRDGVVAVLASGQAVVYYRVAIMSKDGDWVVRETAEATRRILRVLAERGAWYRPGAPLDVRWLAGGWSSHFEFADEAQRRIRCDFFSRPPRITEAAREALFTGSDPLAVVDLESLILMKQTLRAKDYVVIGELASRLPAEREIQLSTDPDRLIALAAVHGASVSRPAVRAAMTGDREAVMVALAREQSRQQEADRARLAAYASAAAPFIQSVTRLTIEERRLPDSQARLCELAGKLLPQTVSRPSEMLDADAQ